MSKAKYLLFGLAAVILAAAIFTPMPKPQKPAEHVYARLPSPPVPAEPSISNQQIEQRELSLDQISGLSAEQTVGLLSRMTPTERAELGRRLTLLPATSLNNEKIGLFFRAWAKFDPKAAFQMALNFAHKSQSWLALTSVFDGADPKDTMTLVESLQRITPPMLSGEVAQSLLLSALPKWASVDGAGAAAWLDKFGGEVSPAVWKAVAETWAKIDPAAALAWAAKQSNSDFKDSQMDGVITGWAKTDLPAAAQYAREHLDGTLKSETRVAHAANQLAAKDPKAAIAYIESLPEGTAKQLAQTMAAASWAYNDPVAAAAWVSSLPPDGQGAAAVTLVAQWAPQDPRAAMDWVATLQGPAHDSAISAYSANIALHDPGTALGWAQSIASDSMRTSTVEALVVQWLERDRASASAWINRSQLPVEEKQRLLSSR
jgi:hypothetical protein